MTNVERRRADASPPNVVITGVGLCTALGADRESSWAGARAGRSGCRWLDIAPARGEPPHAGFVVPVSVAKHSPRALILRAAREAASDAGLDTRGIDPERVGCVIGLSKGDLGLLGDCLDAHRQGRFDQAAAWVDAWPSAGASIVGDALDLRGPRLGPIAACATGLVAALRGADLVTRGDCDIVLVGAADASIDPLVLAAFRRMGVLARVDPRDDPSRAIRPWDRRRTGFLVGEGAAVLVLEREEHARRRGVLPYSALAGGALGADAHHITSLDPDPAHLAALIRRALANANTQPREIDHVNVHGTATTSNDPLECRALRHALGAHASSVSCSANKAQIGHCLGAAGAVELALTVLAARDGFVPPTLNLEDPDPACDLDGTPRVGRVRSVAAALALSIGFGGHLAAAVLRRVDGGREPVSGDVGP